MTKYTRNIKFLIFFLSHISYGCFSYKESQNARHKILYIPEKTIKAITYKKYRHIAIQKYIEDNILNKTIVPHTIVNHITKYSDLEQLEEIIFKNWGFIDPNCSSLSKVLKYAIDNNSYKTINTITSLLPYSYYSPIVYTPNKYLKYSPLGYALITNKSIKLLIIIINNSPTKTNNKICDDIISPLFLLKYSKKKLSNCEQKIKMFEGIGIQLIGKETMRNFEIYHNTSYYKRIVFYNKRVDIIVKSFIDKIELFIPSEISKIVKKYIFNENEIRTILKDNQNDSLSFILKKYLDIGELNKIKILYSLPSFMFYNNSKLILCDKPINCINYLIREWYPRSNEQLKLFCKILSLLIKLGEKPDILKFFNYLRKNINHKDFKLGLQSSSNYNISPYIEYEIRVMEHKLNCLKEMFPDKYQEYQKSKTKLNNIN